MLTLVHDKDVYNEGLAEGHAEGRSAGFAESIAIAQIETTIRFYLSSCITKQQAPDELNMSMIKWIK